MIIGWLDGFCFSLARGVGRQQTKSACVEERERGVDKNREYDGCGWYGVLLSIRSGKRHTAASD